MSATVTVLGFAIEVAGGQAACEDAAMQLLAQAVIEEWEPEGYEPDIDRALAEFLAAELAGEVTAATPPEFDPDTIY